MKPDTSGSVIDRIIAWLRGFFAAGKSATDTAARDVRHAARDVSHTVREGVDDAGQRVRDLTGRGAGTAQRSGDETAAGGGRSSFGAAATASSVATGATAAATGRTDEPTDEEVALRSDFDDAAGDWETGDETYPSGESDLASATHVHDAVGGEDERADDSTDGIIDTTRDADLNPAGTEEYQGREVKLQDELIVSEGASSDEFDGDEITVGDVDTSDVTRADVESAAEGYGDTTNTDLANTSDRGTSTLTGSTYTETDVVVPPAVTGEEPSGAGGAASGAQDQQSAGGGSEPAEPGSFHVVERYNYGMGDLGVGAGTTPGDAWSGETGDDVTTGDIHTGVDADINAAAQDDTGATNGGQAAANASGASAGTSPTLAGDTGATAQGLRAAPYGAGAGEDVSAQPMGSGIADRVDEVPEGAVSGTPGDIDASVSADATRTEIESQSRGDAVNRSDEATQTPGFGAPETFDEASTGTTEPSRSATGNELDEDQDALGTTLDYEAESDAFDEDAANLSGEDELTVSDEDLDYGPERGGNVERVATFQSGTIAHEGLVGEDVAQVDPEVTAEAYADLPDEPELATADDTGLDDFSGSDYPSDRVVDVLDGDDFTDAEEPDIADLDSSAGDLATDTADITEGITDVTPPVERTIGTAGSRVDQDVVGTSDEHVGGEEPDFAEAASRGTDETSFDDLGAGAQVVDEALAASEGAAGSFAADDVTGPGDLGAGAGGTTAAQREPELGGMGTSDGGVTAPPAGSVRGDGGTEAPEGYPVKGNANSMIYHLPDFPSYAGTKAEYYFATEQDAIAAGYRAPGNVRRTRSGESTGDGEVAVERPSGGADVASESPTGVVTTADTSGERDDRATYPPASAAGAATGVVSEEAGAPSGASVDVDIPVGAVRGDGSTNTPAGYPVKGNANSMIYHLPSFPSYKNTKAEFCFASEQDALNAGYRAPGKRNRGRKS